MTWIQHVLRKIADASKNPTAAYRWAQRAVNDEVPDADLTNPDPFPQLDMSLASSFVTMAYEANRDKKRNKDLPNFKKQIFWEIEHKESNAAAAGEIITGLSMLRMVCRA